MNRKKNSDRQNVAKLLSTNEAISFLSTLGIKTSRRLLDDLRADGTLSYVKTRGQYRVMYRAIDLEQTFIEIVNSKRSAFDRSKRQKTRKDMAGPSREDTYASALKMASKKKRDR